ncbi:MAG TPA: bifunctional phosphoribosyl-AMP cyclohydrolase/phosphoribosyl-ATP diphosphatase HisIE [Candidatus Limnocylindrales bacterium]
MTTTATASTRPKVTFGPDGLVPAIVQDAADGTVLMLAWMDAAALDATIRTGDVHFHSRSRNALWRKGETSGNTLRLAALAVDCDADTLLVTAEPAGPTCHRGTRTCFDAVPLSPGERTEPAAAAEPPAAPEPDEPAAEGFGWLETLWATIASRAATRPAGSYTTSLLDGGVDATARKVAEEATEVVLAAKDDAAAESAASDRTATRHALASEVADLVYHALVVLAERHVPPADVIATLRDRHRA